MNGGLKMVSVWTDGYTKEVAMRMLTVSIVIGPLVVIGALPAAAGQSTLALG